MAFPPVFPIVGTDSVYRICPLFLFFITPVQLLWLVRDKNLNLTIIIRYNAGFLPNHSFNPH